MLDKIKSLSKQTLIYGTSTIVGRFLNFLLVPFYTNVFVPSDYGVFAVVFAYIAFLNIFFSLGLESGYFKFASTGEFGSKEQNFSIPFIAISLNSLFLSLIVFLFSSDIASLLSSTRDYSTIVKYSSLILFFDAVCLIPYAYLRLNNRAGIFAAVRIVNIAVNVAFNLIFVLIYKMGIEAVFLSNVIASILTFIMLMPFVIKNLSFSYNSELFRELLKFSLPYIPAGLASIMMQVVSRPIMLYLTDEATVGIFQANFKLGIFMMLIVSMFEYAWRPFFLNQASDPDAKKIFSRVLTIFIGGTSVVLIMLTFFIEDLIKIPVPPRGHIIGSKYWGGVFIVPLILFGYQFYGIYINFMSGIYIEKKTKYLPLITGLGAVVNIAANFLLIPVWGLFGAALATFLSYAAMTFYMYRVSDKFYHINYEWNKVMPMLIINSAVLSLFYYFEFFGVKPGLLIRIIAVVILTMVLVYISGFSKVKLLFKK